ncbi:MAG TPA: orotate phosphoribosyltransferase [Ignavibacteria bacterium]|nr:orotate phosphoribosyltransferase [Ignavibacteria bacterium]
MTKQQILQIFKDSSALLEGHFVLTSGLHSQHYVEKFRVLEQPRYTEMLCKELAGKFVNDKISVVVGPMTGGIILAYEVGKQLGTKSIFTERVEGKMKFRRGFSLSPADRVLIVEDIITTGGSIFEVMEEVKKFNCTIVGIGALVDRSNGKAQFSYTFKPLITMDVVAYKPEECPLCKSGVPVTKPGSTNK